MFGRAGGARLAAGVRVVLGGSVSSRVEGKGLVAGKGLQSLLGFFFGGWGGRGVCVPGGGGATSLLSRGLSKSRVKSKDAAAELGKSYIFMVILIFGVGRENPFPLLFLPPPVFFTASIL